jgi:hypothetical protein|tara:strand:- start:16082 stop:16720 length:639 start_codon:yes stop_codon:yes gene_type:complete
MPTPDYRNPIDIGPQAEAPPTQEQIDAAAQGLASVFQSSQSGTPVSVLGVDADGKGGVLPVELVKPWQIFDYNYDPVTHTGDTAEQALRTIQIPGGAWRAIRIISQWSAGANNANAKTPRGRLGGSAGTAFMFGTMASLLTLRDERLIFLREDGSQVSGASGAQGGWGTSSGAIVTSALDATQDITYVLSAQLANAADTLRLDYYQAELLPI